MEEEVKETKETKKDKTKSELVSAKAEIEKLTKEKADEHDLLLRTAAEYDNYRRRTAEEMTRKFGDGKAETLEKLLPVLDSVRMALAAEHSDDDPVYQGVCLIAKQLDDVLASLGKPNVSDDPATLLRALRDAGHSAIPKPLEKVLSLPVRFTGVTDKEDMPAVVFGD